MKDIIMIGANLDMIEFAEKLNYQVIGIIEKLEAENYYGYEVFGDDTVAEKILKKYQDVGIAIIPDNPIVRFKLYNHYKKFTNNFENLISDDVLISKYAKIGYGMVIQEKVKIMANAMIGNFTRLNTSAHVGNDSIVSDFCTLAPKTVIGGRSKIGRFTHLGISSTIVPGKEIGNNIVIGAGTVVTKNVSDDVVVVGNPGRVIRTNAANNA